MPEDSITFVLRSTNPIMVRNTSAVIDAPINVEDRGDVAAEGYVFEMSR